jgi:MtaA/CmuA family methyltransferase
MTKSEALRSLLTSGKNPPDRIIFHPILMQFAARHYQSTYTEFMTDYRVLVEANIHCLKKFDIDAIGLISDPYRETSAFGANVEFSGNRSPYCAPIVSSIEDIERLNNPNIHKADRTADRLKAAEYYRQLLGDSVPIVGWIEGPLAEAADLAGVNNILVKILMEEEFVRQLMDKCMNTAKDFARAQVEAGCMVIGIGDAVCSQVDSDTYQKLIMPLHQDLADYIHSLGAFVKLHICGDITHLLDHLGRTGIDILDLDWMVSFSHAREAMGPGVVLCGNLDPVNYIQNLSKKDLAKETQRLLKEMKGSRFILSGGCEITPDTPAKNLKIMREISYNKDFGKTTCTIK